MLTYKKSELGVKLSAKSQQNFTQNPVGRTEANPREGRMAYAFIFSKCWLFRAIGSLACSTALSRTIRKLAFC